VKVNFESRKLNENSNYVGNNPHDLKRKIQKEDGDVWFADYYTYVDPGKVRALLTTLGLS